METPTLDLTRGRRADLLQHLPEPSLIESQVDAVLAEDVGAGDLTAALLPVGQRARAELITREPATLCGCAWFETVFRRLDSDGGAGP